MVVNLENKAVYHPARQFYSPISQPAVWHQVGIELPEAHLRNQQIARVRNGSVL